MDTPFLKYSRIVIFGLSIILIIINFVFGFFGVMAQIARQKTNRVDPGIQYAAFKKDLEGVRIAGFLSDGNETPEGNDGQFMLAQYMLAPTILDLNISTHRYSILDCSTPGKAMGILKIINAKPIRVNLFGKILAEKNL